MSVAFPFKGPAEITHINTSIASTVVGGKVELQCVSDGDPTPTVTWYSPNGTELVTITGDSTIFIVVDGPSDFGDYRCKAYNGFGPPVERVVSVDPIGKSSIPASESEIPLLLMNSLYSNQVTYPAGAHLYS